MTSELWLIALFGLLHGINEWIEMFMMIASSDRSAVSMLQIFRAITLPLSFFFLLQFAANMMCDKKFKFLKLLPSALFIFCIAAIFTTREKFLMEDIYSRYLLAIPGIFLTSYALILQVPEFGAKNLERVRKNLKLAASSFFFYGLFAGFIVPRADFFPASVINYETFYSLVGVHIQVFRAITAFIAAFSLTKILFIFDIETDMKIQKLVVNLSNAKSIMERDIEAREKIEVALRESEKKYRDLIENSREGIWVLDRHSFTTFINPSMARMLGYKAEEMIGRHFFSFMDEEGIKNCREDLEACRRGIRDQHEFQFITKAGTRLFADIDISPLADEDGDYAGAAVSIMDITERKFAEEALIASEERYRSLVDNLAIGVFRITADLDGKFIHSNLTGARILGYDSIEDFLKLPVSAHFLDPAEQQQLISQVVQKGFIKDEEVRLKKKNGALIWCSITARVQFDEDGSIQYIDGVMEDITERKLIENARTRLATIIEATSDCAFIVDMEGKVQYMNRAMRDKLGIKEDAKVSHTKMLDYYPAWAGSVVTEKALPIAMRMGVWSGESAMKLPDGREISVSQVVIAHKVQYGSVDFFASVMRDITEIKQAEKQLETQLIFLQRLIDSIPNPIFFKDMSGIYRGCNTAFEKFAGYPKSDIVGKSIADIFPKEAASVYLAKDEELLADPGVQIYEKSVQYPDGTMHDVVFSKATYADTEGKVTGIVGAIMDITERKRAEEALKQTYLELKAAQHNLVQSEKLAALGRFSAGIAHEIKNPLGIILGGMEFLGSELEGCDDEIRIAIEKIKEATLKADTVLHDLLKFARPSALKKEKTNPNDLITNSLSLFKYRVPSNVSITTELAKDEVYVNVDQNQLVQVLINILMNAVEAMPEHGGSVRIRIFETDMPEFPAKHGHCVIEVCDTGEGIDKEDMAKMFEPFFTTKRDRKGTGLGLFIAKTVVDNNNGRLVITSESGKGTTIRIILPIMK
ncbi:MAG: PAS domain S-box protein [Candidatus Omnitrophota bacterium]